VIANEQEERLIGSKRVHAPDGVSVTERGGLLEEFNPPCVIAGGAGIGGLVARANHHADFLHARIQDFLDDDAQGGFLDSIAVHNRLQGQGALSLSSGRYDRFLDLHG
jgi:hypothetical protein